jgi:hypothetical protein
MTPGLRTVRAHKEYKKHDTFLCECGMTVAKASGTHFTSRFHQLALRITALLKTDCLSFAEIGDRIGVSRQRVHQIAKNLGCTPGRVRQKVCAVRKRVAKRAGYLDAKHADLMIRCGELGLDLRPVDSSTVLVNGCRCSVSRCVKPLIVNGTEYAHLRVRRKGVEFALVKGPGPSWFVFPASLPLPITTSFSLDPKMTGAKEDFHDYLRYREAWHLLKPELQRGVWHPEPPRLGRPRLNWGREPGRSDWAKEIFADVSLVVRGERAQVAIQHPRRRVEYIVNEARRSPEAAELKIRTRAARTEQGDVVTVWAEPKTRHPERP